jgi:hypothetical protein
LQAAGKSETLGKRKDRDAIRLLFIGSNPEKMCGRQSKKLGERENSGAVRQFIAIFENDPLPNFLYEKPLRQVITEVYLLRLLRPCSP